MIDLHIESETGLLKAVLLHEPGPEVENMTPATAERALYSDILNQSVASREYAQFKEILGRGCTVYELKDLLAQVLQIPEAKKEIIDDLRKFIPHIPVKAILDDLPAPELLRQLIEGVPFSQRSLSHFLSQEKYLISPLHNAFYTRDASFIFGNMAFISAMAKRIRVPEAIMMSAIFNYSPEFKSKVASLCDAGFGNNELKTLEGGDILVFNREILIIGIGSRTSAQGVDWLVQQLAETSNLKYVLVQELPDQPESFIHLDMVFTLLSKEECLLYQPLILGQNKYHTVLLTIEGKRISGIEYIENLLAGLSRLGYDLDYISCGGSEQRMQEREQWHSGANLFAFGPSKLIGYDRNIHTAEELNKKGYTILKATDVIERSIIPNDYAKLLITIEGSELSRGGGGTRCMTLPLSRD
jgi:arginine deiminase